MHSKDVIIKKMKLLLIIIPSIITLQIFPQLTNGQNKINQAVVINNSTYIKPIKDKTQGIEEYLKHFKLISQYENRGKKSGNPNWNPADGDDPYSWYSRSISVYDKGIVMWGYNEHESASYELYIPLLSIEQAKNLLEPLCRNMGGCLTPEDVNVTFETFQDGVLLKWGGGC
jgi:hypothetical protein